METQLPAIEEINAAASVVYRHFSPTPQYAWPLLREHCNCDIWVKHENHTPIGSFKLRGGLVYMEHQKSKAIIAATRGNHGQAVAYAAKTNDATATIVVPHGNSREKNAAMIGLGAKLIEHGRDFNESLDYANDLAQKQELHFFPSFARNLYLGASTYGLELFQAVPKLDAVYVPIGLGSGICGVIAAREALGLNTEVVGVVAENAAAYAHSFDSKTMKETDSANTFADGMAVRVPNADALEIIFKHVARVIQVSENEIENAIRLYYTATHNVVEGAGASTLAAVIQEGSRIAGKRVAVVASGGNIDTGLYSSILDQTV